MSGPIPLHRYRAFKRGKADERADHIRALADQLGLPISALAGSDVRLAPSTMAPVDIPKQPFDAQALEYQYPNAIAAKLDIAADLAQPLAKLSADDRAFIDRVLAGTLARSAVLTQVRNHFRNKKPGEEHAR